MALVMERPLKRMRELTGWNIVQKGDQAVGEADVLKSQTGMTQEDINNLMNERKRHEKIHAGSLSALFKGNGVKGQQLYGFSGSFMI